jgi:hypothetical protein
MPTASFARPGAASTSCIYLSEYHARVRFLDQQDSVEDFRLKAFDAKEFSAHRDSATKTPARPT